MRTVKSSGARSPIHQKATPKQVLSLPPRLDTGSPGRRRAGESAATAVAETQKARLHRQADQPPASSRVVMAPKRAPVRSRALSITSCRTVSGSRLSLMRRLASLRRDSRSRSASVTSFPPGCSILPPSSYLLPNRACCRSGLPPRRILGHPGCTAFTRHGTRLAQYWPA